MQCVTCVCVNMLGFPSSWHNNVYSQSGMLAKMISILQLSFHPLLLLCKYLAYTKKKGGISFFSPCLAGLVWWLVGSNRMHQKEENVSCKGSDSWHCHMNKRGIIFWGEGRRIKHMNIVSREAKLDKSIVNQAPIHLSAQMPKGSWYLNFSDILQACKEQ